ncbi:MAG TPA: efflux RND transporter periplasmic adaptor subunit [Bryobacteraceae bacterium]|jgi:multidrug resistance efflux pump|nr:efflux RND transporter periplasmic adaptor subunit [Bryobacteraceae bacterium]
MTGLVRAVRVYSIQAPQIVMTSPSPQGNRITLVTVAANGATVKKGDTLAEFDNTKQLDDALEAEAKFDDFTHQVAQKAAQNRSDAAVRLAELKQAEVDFGKANIQLTKGPILSEIDRIKNEAKAESARALVASLQKSHAAHMRAEAAALRVLELQRERQKVALDRARTNSDKLTIKATLNGMVALENIWKGGTMGHAKEGDQLYGGQPLMKIFDPSEMVVDLQVGEPDGTRLSRGLKARVRLDAYPDLELDAEFVSASPVAVTALGSPVKNFNARFRLLKSDPRLLPDLSAAVIIQP